MPIRIHLYSSNLKYTESANTTVMEAIRIVFTPASPNNKMGTSKIRDQIPTNAQCDLEQQSTLTERAVYYFQGRFHMFYINPVQPLYDSPVPLLATWWMHFESAENRKKWLLQQISKMTRCRQRVKQIKNLFPPQPSFQLKKTTTSMAYIFHTYKLRRDILSHTCEFGQSVWHYFKEICSETLHCLSTTSNLEQFPPSLLISCLDQYIILNPEPSSSQWKLQKLSDCSPFKSLLNIWNSDWWSQPNAVLNITTSICYHANGTKNVFNNNVHSTIILLPLSTI